MASNMDNKDEGEMEASPSIKEARNFDPQMFKERKVIAVRRSIS